MISDREPWQNVTEKEDKWWSQGSEEAGRARSKNLDLVVSIDHPFCPAPFCGSGQTAAFGGGQSFPLSKRRTSHPIGSHLTNPRALFEREALVSEGKSVTFPGGGAKEGREGEYSQQSHDGNGRRTSTACSMEDGGTWLMI